MTRSRLGVFVLAMAAMTVLTASAFAADSEEPSGRQVAASGAIQDRSGVLKELDGEWYLEQGETRYQLHLGPLGHEGDLGLKDGASAEVRGFVSGEHIAPIVLRSGGKSYSVWTESRFPTWAGSGDGEGRGAADGARRMGPPASRSGAPIRRAGAGTERLKCRGECDDGCRRGASAPAPA